MPRAVFVMKMFLDDYSDNEIRNMPQEHTANRVSTTVAAPVHILNDRTAFLELCF